MRKTVHSGLEHGGRGEWTSSRAILALIAGFLLAPFVFLFDLGFRFALVEWACSHGSFVLWLVSLLAIVLAGGGGLLAWRSWQHLNATARDREATERGSAQSTGHTLSDELRTDEGGPHGRSRFFALAGITASVFFLAVIVISILPKLLLSPCM
jgi:hypothetical protein